MDYSRVKVGIYDDQQKYKNEEELLIFGYSCKLFRDDEKAISMENGEHLIPWMGDSSLMIDRFDVRGTLYDLSEAEGSSGRPLEEILSAVELKEEQLCDQERYFALYQDEQQYQLAYEEEAKRLQAELAGDGSYNQVGFNYSAPPAPAARESTEQQIPSQVPEPVTYNPSSNEEIFIPPQEMNIPYGLEVPRTVKQNKIILKTAKFIVSQGAQMEILIKTKQAGNPMFNFLAFDNPLNAYYKHVVSLIRNGRYRWEDEAEGSSKSDSKDQYLHPNLSQSVRPDLTPGAVASPTRPSPHCAYSKLITKIREKQKASAIEDSEAPSPILPSSPLHASVQVQDSPQISAKNSGEPVVGLVDYPSFNQTQDGNSEGEEVEPAFTKKFSKSGSAHDYRNIKWPPPELQMVIDKMASYIIKNGSGFEEVVRNRGDPRFEFLNKTDDYHPYYKCKLQLYSEVYGDIFKNTSKSHDWKKKKSPEQMKNGGGRTISFSIKSREQEVPLTSHTTFPVESSTSEEDEELDEEERERRRIERVQRRQARRQKEEKERKEREEFLRRERLKKEKEEEEKRKKNVEEESSENEDLYDIFKYAQEMEEKDGTDSKTRVESPEDSPEANSKQEERKKKAVAFLSKLKDEKPPAPIYGPQMPPNFAASVSKSASHSSSPNSSRASSAEVEKSPPPPPPAEVQPPPPPPPAKSPSLPPVAESSKGSSGSGQFAPGSRIAREISESPKRRAGSLEDSTSAASVFIGLNEPIVGKQVADLGSELVETHTRKSRSHKKHSRSKCDSWSPSSSSRRGRKKRKRSRGSTHRRKKRRSRSRSRSREYSKSHRSSHKKKQSKHSSHRDKSRKKKHKRHRSPSSVSSLPSSESSSPSTPSTLPSESESEMEVQVIECQESDDGKRSSRGSSIVSLPSVRNHDTDLNPVSKRLSMISEVEEASSRREGSLSGEETSRSLRSSSKHSRHLFTPRENSNSSEGLSEVEKKPLFNPNTSSAMAKIAQGLRAKLNAMLEKEGKLD